MTANFFAYLTLSSFRKFSAGATDHGGVLGGCNFGKKPTHQGTKILPGEKLYFLAQYFQARQSKNYHLEPALYQSYECCASHKTAGSGKIQ